MSEQRRKGVPFDSDANEEQDLWQALGSLEQAEPPPRMRRKFYAELDSRSRQTRWDRWRNALGLLGLRGAATAAVCAIAGIVVGVSLHGPGGAESARLDSLQQQVTELNRNLILDRLESSSASKRLLGVLNAAEFAEHDSEVARALLARAVDDRVYSVRAAAIDAIGPQLNTPAVGDELMTLLESTQSPLVQLALVDLILRHGNPQQTEQLLKLSERGELHPDLAQHVKETLWRKPV